jgi:hypothetical protein
MPFTFSHPAAVLPLNSLPKKWISMTGLVVGSMIPDFEYFIRMSVKSIYSHTWPGLFWFDLPLGLFIVLLYNGFVKDKVIDHLPAGLNRRLSNFKGNDKATSPLVYLLIVCLCVLIGGISHLLWDDFTHPAGYFVRLIPILSNTIYLDNHKLYVYNLVQHFSTLAGGLIVFWVVMKLPKGNNTRVLNISLYWLKIFLVTIVVMAIRFSIGFAIPEYGNLIVTCISGIFLGLLMVSISGSSNVKPISGGYN